MKKIIILCLSSIVLFSCSKQSGYLSAIKDFSYMTPFDNQEKVAQVNQSRVAVLLPLSGESAELGDYFRNAILMAQLEKTTPNASQTLFYDTLGTVEGAKAAFEQAKHDKPDVILGPIFANEVQGVAKENTSIPMISFTSDETVLNDNTFSMALFISQQVNRIAQHACEAGTTQFALIGPKNKTGELVLKAFENAKSVCPELEIVKKSVYNQDGNLTDAVAKIAPPLIDAKNPDLTEEEKAYLTNPTADRLDFNALFVFEQGVNLQQLTSLLNYYDVRADLVPFYGLATLRYNHNKELQGAFFADLPQEKLQIFRQNYYNAFGKDPVLIAGLAYDAFSFVNILAHQQLLNIPVLTNQEGYQGINGRFRLNPDGTNDRLLEVFTIAPHSKIKKVSRESYSFDSQDLGNFYQF